MGGAIDYVDSYMPSHNNFDVMFGIVFTLILVVIGVNIIRGAMEWSHNSQSPRLCVDARVVAKRMQVTHHHHHHQQGMGMSAVSSSTTYYATFEVASGDRMELKLSGSAYGLLAEGDVGKLTFQGTRFLSFERNIR